MIEPRKIVCHAPGERCLGCDHYQGKSDVCKYADPVPTEPRKTLRVDNELAQSEKWGTKPAAREHYLIKIARALEIETQELEAALAEYVSTDKQAAYHRNGIGTETAVGIRYSTAKELLTRHRAKQEVQP